MCGQSTNPHTNQTNTAPAYITTITHLQPSTTHTNTNIHTLLAGPGEGRAVRMLRHRQPTSKIQVGEAAVDLHSLRKSCACLWAELIVYGSARGRHTCVCVFLRTVGDTDSGDGGLGDEKNSDVLRNTPHQSIPQHPYTHTNTNTAQAYHHHTPPSTTPPNTQQDRAAWEGATCARIRPRVANAHLQ